MPEIHLEYGGSSAARDMHCPAWRELSKDMPAGDPSPYAVTGTELHDVIESMVAAYEEDTPVDVPGLCAATEHLDPSHVSDKLEPALEAYDELMISTFGEGRVYTYGTEVLVVRPESPNIGGTLDFIASGNGTCIIGDWKFGDGVMVSPENNAQAMFYAMCARDDPKTRAMICEADVIKLAIIQPTQHDNSPTLKVWETDHAALDLFEKRYFQALRKANDPAEPPVSGAHCKFCPALSVCPLKTGKAHQAKKMRPELLERLDEALALADELDDWIREVRSRALDQAERGAKFDDWKLVQKRATRKWTDEPAIAELLRRSRKIKADEAYDHKLKSPAQMEKLFADKGVDFGAYKKYVAAMSSGNTLVKRTDKRAEVPGIHALDEVRERLSGA